MKGITKYHHIHPSFLHFFSLREVMIVERGLSGQEKIKNQQKMKNILNCAMFCQIYMIVFTWNRFRKSFFSKEMQKVSLKESVKSIENLKQGWRATVLDGKICL